MTSAATRWTAPEGVWTEPDLHLFPQDGHRYRAVHSVEGAEPVKLDAPYPLRIAPAAWL